jgi:Flp pilus assembly protein TadG
MTLLLRTRDEEGQVIVFVVAILAVLIGIAALVVDGGSWFRAHRHAQTAADAAALAGVQELTASTSDAQTMANQYAQNNYSALPTPEVTFPTAPSPPCSSSVSNCIRVVATTTTPGFFARIFGTEFDNVTVQAKAMAAVTVPSMMKNVAPVAVRDTIACGPRTTFCFNQTKQIEFSESNVSSSTGGLIDLTCHATAQTACGENKGIGGNELNSWIVNGYADALPSGQWYGVKTGQTIGPVVHGLEARLNVPLFFPVFDEVYNNGPAYYFHIIGWAAFVVTHIDSWSPRDWQLTGHFVTYTTSDLPAGLPPDSSNDFGVHILSLVE